MDLKINEELRKLIPPLTAHEFEQLEHNIIKNGCRDPIVFWDSSNPDYDKIIIDGHNRFKICTENNIQFDVVGQRFESIEDAKIFMIDNQAGRRNLTDGWKFDLAQAKKALLLAKGREKISEKMKERPRNEDGTMAPNPSLPTIGKDGEKSKPHNTQQELAESLGWSKGKVSQAEIVWREAEPEIKEKIKSGDMSINEAYREIKLKQIKEDRTAEIERQRKEIELKKSILLPAGDKKYDVIVVDPPWNYGREYDPEGSRVANPYPEMSQNELLKLQLPFKDNSVLFLWTTHAFIWDAKELLDFWGFDYKATLVWDKEKMGMGAWVRMQCEFCLIGIKGKPFFHNTEWRDIIKQKRREHSRKPDLFYDFVNAVTAGERLDYFSRQKREGWDSFGNDTDKF